MDFEQAKQAFELYLNGYDRKDEKVYLKIVHTYGVVDCSEEIARRMGLGEEDIFLAKIIALLHDIGRFEQLKLYDSFEPGIFDPCTVWCRYFVSGGANQRISSGDNVG